MPFGTLPLNDGKTIPVIAFGTGSIYKRTDVREMVQQALAAGFRHVDTAQRYYTEGHVGQIIRESDLKRSELYITSKLGTGDVRDVLEKSLSDLGLSYVDLYLIHEPRLLEGIDLSTIWRQFEILQREGKAKGVRSIGVSNFSLEQLQRLVQNALVVPAVNQIQLHPYNYAQRRAVIDWGKEYGIVSQAFGCLSSITKFPGGPVDIPVSAAAAWLGITPAQVLFSWARAKGVAIVTTTSSKERMGEYLDVGDLPPLLDAEVAAIDEAGKMGPVSSS